MGIFKKITGEITLFKVYCSFWN